MTTILSVRACAILARRHVHANPGIGSVQLIDFLCDAGAEVDRAARGIDVALARGWIQRRDGGLIAPLVFDAILREIERLRAGKPTAIRLVDAANPFVSDPSMAPDLPKDVAATKGALTFKLLNDALCHNAAKHHAVCVDVRPILNGPTLDKPVDENSPASMRAVAKPRSTGLLVGRVVGADRVRIGRGGRDRVAGVGAVG
jgi:hypothetical protein